MLPNCIIIGAEKAGTSSLHYYLSLHPEIFMSQNKELNFFSQSGNWFKGLDWYKSNFKDGHKICGEASPCYTQLPFHPGVAQRMHQTLPQAKLIYIVRDPIERMISAFMDNQRSFNRDPRPIEEALTSTENNLFLETTKYHQQLNEYLNYYPENQILYLTAAELDSSPDPTIKKVFDFLKVDPNFVHENFKKRINVGKAKKQKQARTKPRMWIRYYLTNALGARLMRLTTPPYFKKKIYAAIQETTPLPRPQIQPQTRAKILELLQPDLKKFHQLTGIHFTS